MKNPLVSIITVTFNLVKNNRVNTFKQCVGSVHNQSYKNIEHLIIDGNSTDGTKELLKTYEKKGWIKVISEPDKGIYDAMNKGISLSKGKYLAFLNSDDFYHDKDGINESVKCLEKSKAAFSYAPVRMITETGNNLLFYHPQINPDAKNVFFTMPFCHQTMFFKREVLLKNYTFDDSYKSAGDYDLVLRMCINNFSSVKVEKKFVTFRLTGVSSINQKQSLEESSKLYFVHYSKLCDIKKIECENIYDGGYTAIPMKLAIQLKTNRYFDFDYYMEEIEKARKNFIYMQKTLQKSTDELNRIRDSKIWRFGQFIKKIIFEIKDLNFIKR